MAGPPILLTAEELDAATAAGARVIVEVSAFAEGPEARTETSSQASVIQRPILVVVRVDGPADYDRAEVAGEWTAELALGFGRAFAAGRVRETVCSAIPSVDGVVSLVGTAMRRIETPTTTECRCSAAAITAFP